MGRWKTFVWYYIQAIGAVGLLWLSNLIISNKYPLAWVISAEGALAASFSGGLLFSIGTADRFKRRERLRKYTRFLILTLGWLVGLINQAFAGIVTGLAPLAFIPVPVFQTILGIIIALVIGLIAGLIWVLDTTKAVVEVGRRVPTIFWEQTKPEVSKQYRIHKWIRLRWPHFSRKTGNSKGGGLRWAFWKIRFRTRWWWGGSRARWLWTNIKRFSWVLAVVNIATIGYGITNVYYASDMNSVSIYCVSANYKSITFPDTPPAYDYSRIDITVGLNRSQSFISGFAESISTVWRITLLLNLPSQEWMYVNASSPPITLGQSTKFNMTFDSTVFNSPWNISVDSISVTDSYSSGDSFYPLGVVHVNSKYANINLPYNSTNVLPRLLKVRQILIQNILLLSGLPVVTIPHGCLRNGVY